MITPGLERIHRLLASVPRQWPAIHIAGTNGKGSVSAYISSMLRRGGLRVGRFNSPHLVSRRDSISINDMAVRQSHFHFLDERVKSRNDEGKIRASEFEILTATAFECFNHIKVDVAVVECGMGGLLDATNVLERPLAAVITPISLDHQEWLGHDLRSIATHKAGIIRPGCVCVVDGSNEPEVLEVITDAAATRNARIVVVPPDIPSQYEGPEYASVNEIAKRHMHVAFRTLATCMPEIQKIPGFKYPHKKSLVRTAQLLAPAMRRVSFKGRWQHISIANSTGRVAPIMLDGAHNPAAWKLLKEHVADSVRVLGAPVTWVLALSKKSVSPAEMMESLTEAGDRIIAVEFGPVDGMPWVLPTPSQDFAESGVPERSVESYETDLRVALHRASELADGGPIVITGSLYLAGDVLRRRSVVKQFGRHDEIDIGGSAGMSAGIIFRKQAVTDQKSALHKRKVAEHSRQLAKRRFESDMDAGSFERNRKAGIHRVVIPVPETGTTT